MAAIQGDWYASAGAPNEAYPERDGTVRFVYADQPNGERYIVAKVWAGDDQDYEGTARLVAAAPALLAALKQFLGPAGPNGWPCYCGEPDMGTDYCDYCAARTAIAKAEGRGE